MRPDTHLARGGRGSEIKNCSYFKITYSNLNEGPGGGQLYKSVSRGQIAKIHIIYDTLKYTLIVIHLDFSNGKS